MWYFAEDCGPSKTRHTGPCSAGESCWGTDNFSSGNSSPVTQASKICSVTEPHLLRGSGWNQRQKGFLPLPALNPHPFQLGQSFIRVDKVMKWAKLCFPFQMASNHSHCWVDIGFQTNADMSLLCKCGGSRVFYFMISIWSSAQNGSGLTVYF